MTVMLVAATGGHLCQLHELQHRIADDSEDSVWVTFENPQSRSLLAGQNVEFIPSIEERDWRGAFRAFADAYRLLRQYSPTAVISTGSAIAVPFLNVAALRGIPAHYIESAARVHETSLTGRLLLLNPLVRMYRQYEFAATRRWRFAGTVFDAFESRSAVAPVRKIRRAVVTVGTGVHPFPRLINKIAQILPDDADVLWQTGSTNVNDLNIRGRASVPAAELDEAIARADVVIGHAGCGTALSALKAGKVPILVPRTAAHGELVDDHQIEVARWLAQRGLALLRQPDDITHDDLLQAASRTVAPVPAPPALHLVGQHEPLFQI